MATYGITPETIATYYKFAKFNLIVVITNRDVICLRITFLSTHPLPKSAKMVKVMMRMMSMAIHHRLRQLKMRRQAILTCTI